MEVFWALGPPLAAAAGLWFAHNRLVALDSRCERASADVDVQLKHRHALLPNLLETVKGFAAHERAALQAVVDARAAVSRATTAEASMRAEAALGAGLVQLVAAAESYPELRASGHFRALRSELADTENKIAAARRFLNAAVDEFNGTLRQFPGNLAGRLTGLRKRPFYDVGIERILMEDPPALSFEAPAGAPARPASAPL